MSIASTPRFCHLTTAEGPDALLVARATITEAVSEPFLAVIHASSERGDLLPEHLLGTGAALHVELASGAQRHWHGIVTRFELGGCDPRTSQYRIELRSWPWLLSRRADCRIFQHLSVPDIVTRVFAAAGCRDFERRLRSSYAPREYCVQYRETDLDFVSRLLEEEGIWYAFVHEQGRHVLVLLDTPREAGLLPPVEYHALDDGQFGRDLVREFAFAQELQTGTRTNRDYDYEDPRNPLHAESRTSQPVGGNTRLEVYDYHPGDYRSVADGERLARVRMQELESAAVRAIGRGDCRAFGAGQRFTLRGHPRSHLDGQEYLLTAVRHTLVQPSAWAAGTDPAFGSETVYRNEFECVPASGTFRPPQRTPRPHIRGPQTAVVVGPAGEEVWVDGQGRVKVQFHWDRRGTRDENSSCWIRTAQAWAGKGFGAIAHPRIGDEVVVEFLEGDPDRPLVTSSVYNARHRPPYTLPGAKTQTGLKSRSTPGGGPANANELRFEDRMGAEQVFLQAERDLQVVVKHDHSGSVGNDEQVQVGNNRTASVGADETLSVGGTRRAAVGGDEVLQVGGAATEQVGTTKLVRAGTSVTIEAGTSITLRCGASTLSMNQAGFITLSGTVVNIAAAMNANLAAPITNVVGAVLSTNTGAVNIVTGGTVARVTGGQVETLASGDNVVKGGKVKINT